MAWVATHASLVREEGREGGRLVSLYNCNGSDVIDVCEQIIAQHILYIKPQSYNDQTPP